MKILNSISDVPLIASLEDLKNIKYVKEKSYAKIVEEITKIDLKMSNEVKEDKNIAVMSKSVDNKDLKEEPEIQIRSILINNTSSMNYICSNTTPNKNIIPENIKIPNKNIVSNKNTILNNIKPLEITNTLTNESFEDDSDSYLQNIKDTYGKYIENQPNPPLMYPDFCDDSSIILCTEIDHFIKHNPTEKVDLSENIDTLKKSNIIQTKQDENSSSSDIVVLDSNRFAMENVFNPKDDDMDKIFDSLSDLTLDDNKKNSSFSKHEDDLIPTSLISSSILNSGTPRKRKYVPGYRSASYAILKATYQYNGSHKHLIVLKAAPYTDAVFDRNQKFSAFSSFNTLQKKGLLHVDSDHKCYLTQSGIELCALMFANDSFNVVEDNEVKIIIDSREKKSNRDRNFFQSYFSSKNIPNQTRHLVVGDFIWIKNEKVIDYIVERKQTSDFVSSISDGRYREQKNRLKNLGFNVFYIIENLKIDEARRNYINRCLLEVRLHGFVLIETESIQETADTLEKIDKMIRTPSLALKEQISYGSFLDEGSKNNITVKDMLLFSLTSVKGLSKDLAIGLSQEYRSMFNFRNNMKNSDFKNKLAVFSVNGKSVGEKIGNRIYSLFQIENT